MKNGIRFVSTMLLFTATLAWSGLESCKFNFGRGWASGRSLAGVDFASIYAGYSGWHSDHAAFTRAVRDANVTGVYYGYLTAFMAREQFGLKDCDMGSPNLCQDGSNFIRQHKTEVLALYTTYATNIKSIYQETGKTPDIVFLIEPDLYQYSKSGSDQRGSWSGQYQNGGGIPDADIAQYFSDIASTIRSVIPNARIGVDISPWIANPSSYYSNFNKSIIDFAFTSGGRTEAASTKIRSENNMTWADAHALTGKPVMADCGYGVGGGSTGHDATWDSESNLRSRFANGVVSINQFNANDNWGTTTLTTLKPALSNLNICTAASSNSGTSSVSTSSSSVNVSSGSNIVTNGDFSTGSILPWVLSNNNSASSTGTISNGALNIAITSAAQPADNSWYIQLSNNVTLQPNTSYIFSFDAKGTKAGTIDPGVGEQQTPYSRYATFASGIAITTTNKNYAIQFVTGATVTPARVEFNLAQFGAGTVTIDNVVLKTGTLSSSSAIPSSSSAKPSSSSVAPSSSAAVPSSSSAIPSSSSAKPSSSSVAPSSSAAVPSSSSATQTGACIAFVNGVGNYGDHCYHSGLTGMSPNTCYTMNPDRNPAPQYINSTATETYWWITTPCVSSSSSAAPSSSSAKPSSSSAALSSSAVVPSSSSVAPSSSAVVPSSSSVAQSSSVVPSSSSMENSSSSDYGMTSSSSDWNASSSSSQGTTNIVNQIAFHREIKILGHSGSVSTILTNATGNHVRILNLHGKEVGSASLAHETLDLQNVQKGIYLIQISGGSARPHTIRFTNR